MLCIKYHFPHMHLKPVSMNQNFALKITLIISVALDLNHHRLFVVLLTNIEMGACDFLN